MCSFGISTGGYGRYDTPIQFLPQSWATPYLQRRAKGRSNFVLPRVRQRRMPSPPPPPPPPSPPSPPQPTNADGGDADGNGHGSSSPITSPKHSRPNKFPFKMLDMLNAGEKEGGRIVGWNPEGDGILIKDVPKFTSDVLPLYFRHSNIGSFQRQLLLYGFVRDVTISATSGQAYRHEAFPRDDREACLRITITRPNGATASSAKSSTGKSKAAASEPKPKPKSPSSGAAKSQRSISGVDMDIPPSAFKTADASRFVLPLADGADQAAAAEQPTAFAPDISPDSADVEMSQQKRRKKKSKTRSFPGAKALFTLGEDASANEHDSGDLDLSTNSDSEDCTSSIDNGHLHGGQIFEGSPAGHYSPMYGGLHSDQPAMPLPLRLCRDEDMHYLSERQCYARRHLVEYFLATKEDAKRRNRLGGNHGIEPNQVGIRCSFCCDVSPELQPKGAISFPRSVKALNAAVGEMLRQHTEKCQYVPAAVKEVLSTLKANRPRTKPGNTNNESPQEYWIRTCAEMGMVDTEGHNGFGGIQLKESGVPDVTIVSTFTDRKRHVNNEEKKDDLEDDTDQSSMCSTPSSAATNTSSVPSTIAGGIGASGSTDPVAYWSNRYSEFKNYNLKSDGGGGKKTKGRATATVKTAKGKSEYYKGTNMKKPANGRLISPEAIQIMKDWLLANAHHPYTSDEQRDALCRQTGLNRMQVKNWLTNGRRRLLRPMLKKMGKGGGGNL